MIPLYTTGAGALENSAGFILMLNDSGSGAVNTTPQKSGGSPTPTFTRATTATTILSTGLPGSVASGTARSMYSPAGIYLGYVSEPASTNLALRSEDFSQAWSAVGTPTNTAGAGCGVITTQIIGDDSAAALEGYTQTVTYTGDAVKAVSLFVKQGTSTSSVIRLRDTSAPADRLLAAITWSGTTPVVTMTTGTDLTGTPEQLGSSGFYRIKLLTTSVTAANTNSLQVYPATDAALAVGNTGTLDCGGVQTENQNFASTYIPTAAGTVTRNADVLTYVAASNLLTGTGTAYAELTTFFAASTGVNNMGIGTLAADATVGPLRLGGQASTVINMNDSTNSTTKSGLTSMTTAVRKRASSWGAGGLSITGDGAAVATSAFDGAIGADGIGVGCGQNGTNQWAGTLKNVRIWLTQLTDAQIQFLTVS